MKSWWLLFLPCGTVLYLGLRLYRWWRSRHVSPAWLIDSERRSWQTGIDQVGVRKWPINKVIDEHAPFQTQRLRKRA